jgi:hypothetical protein
MRGERDLTLAAVGRLCEILGLQLAGQAASGPAAVAAPAKVPRGPGPAKKRARRKRK